MHVVCMDSVWLGGENMTLNVAVGIVVAVCVLCLLTSIAVLLKAQEVYSRCVEILHFTYDWLEEIHHEPEVKAHEGTE